MALVDAGKTLDCAWRRAKSPTSPRQARKSNEVGARDRQESRGAHQRLDFTARDDQNFLKHTLAYHHPKEPPRIEYLDVVITKSQPGVRDYSGAKK